MKSIIAALCFLYGAIANAAFIDLMPPTDDDGDDGSGSIGSPAGFDPSIGYPGILFNVYEDFTISAVSVAVAVEGSVQVSAGIFNEAGSSLASTTQIITNSPDRFRAQDRISSGNSNDWYWYDIPLNFSFESGSQYQLTFPFHEYMVVDGSYTGNQNSWLMTVPHFYDVEGRAGTEPYAPNALMEVVDGTLQGSSYTGIPMIGFVTGNLSVPDIDRAYGYDESLVVGVSEPGAFVLLLLGLMPFLMFAGKRIALIPSACVGLYSFKT